MRKLLFLGFVFFLLTVIVDAQSESTILKATLLNQDPDPARAAETVNLRFRVENIGGKTGNDVEVEILEEYPFSIIPGESTIQNIGTLYAYQIEENAVTIKYKLRIDRNAIQGQHELKLRYRYNKQTWVTISFNIDIKSKEFAQIIYLDKAKLDPGKETDMVFTITNIGSSPLQNLIFSWSEADGVILPVFSDDTKYIRYLDVDESTDLIYIVVADVNANPGLYQLDLKLKYEALINTTATEINTKAGILVGGETDFEIAFSESSQGQTSLSVANTGNNPALSVSVKIPDQNNFRVSGSTSSIIGNLDKGDYTIVSFQIIPIGSFGFDDTTTNREGQSRRSQGSQDQGHNVGSGGEQFSGGNNNLNIIIEYTDTTGERRSIEKTVPIQFRAGGEGTAGQGQFQRRQQTSFFKNRGFLITVLIVVVGLGFYFYRKKGNRNKIMSLVKKNQ